MTATRGTGYLARRAVSVEASIRTRMLKLASELDDVIHLGRGDPDFDSPGVIVKEGVRALESGMHHYTAPPGLPDLQSEICHKLRRDNGLSCSPEQVIVCNGCQEAIFIATLALVDPGDEVILQAPRFNAFDTMVHLAGGRVVDVPTKEEDDFALKAASIREVLTDRTKLILVANPNNPTGALTGRDDLLEIAELAVERNLLVLSDEIYERILFDGSEHSSLATLPDMYERTVTVNGFSKAYAMTGWRIGYLAAPRWFIDPAVEIKHTISICTPPFIQSAALAALRQGEEDLSAMVQTYQQRRDRILEGLDELGVTYGYPRGGLYVYANVSRCGLDAETFCYELLRRERVLLFPGTLFADPGNQHVRITLLSPEEAIQEALSRMGRFIKGL